MEFQAAGGLEAVAAVVSGGSTAPRAQSAVGKVGPPHSMSSANRHHSAMGLETADTG